MIAASGHQFRPSSSSIWAACGHRPEMPLRYDRPSTAPNADSHPHHAPLRPPRYPFTTAWFMGVSSAAAPLVPFSPLTLAADKAGRGAHRPPFSLTFYVMHRAALLLEMGYASAMTDPVRVLILVRRSVILYLRKRVGLLPMGRKPKLYFPTEKYCMVEHLILHMC